MFMTLIVGGEVENHRSFSTLVAKLHLMPEGTAYSVKYEGYPEYNGVANGSMPVEVIRLIETFYRDQNRARESHPELLPGEKFLGNTADSIDVVKKRYPSFRDMRLGSQAYAIDLLPIEGLHPIFYKE